MNAEKHYFEVTRAELFKLIEGQQVLFFEPALLDCKLFRWSWNDDRRMLIEGATKETWKPLLLVC